MQLQMEAMYQGITNSFYFVLIGKAPFSLKYQGTTATQAKNRSKLPKDLSKFQQGQLYSRSLYYTLAL